MPEAPKLESLEVFDLTLDQKNKQKLQLIEELTSNADQVQRRVLEEILTRNADVEYLRRHDLNGRTDRETFKNVMPVITYEDIQPEINRIANGDKSPILSSQPISEFLTRFVINILPSSLCSVFARYSVFSHLFLSRLSIFLFSVFEIFFVVIRRWLLLKS